ncbi:hypothetical protein HU200_018398 [Digitaria exilis]|uniref:F-box protein At3g26010-like beta-propeller domain-containing protein n=1 Tax=Digitaria exilis TaxID=1010633 RepID=A0A835F4E1_9POAL|nr:hypothetical protein HU200_018398 [Digitaria exilis]
MNTLKKSAGAAADLTDDLIVDILSRLPAKSICRFKCHRKKIPQTLSGFFYPSDRWTQEDPAKMLPDFVGILGDEEPFSDASLTFLVGYRSIIPKICCNGLLFCLCWKVSPSDEADYVVCNPATEKWIVLPESGDENIGLADYFCFDPAISPHFYVFQLIDADENYRYIGDVNIYSSETGAWSHKESGWGDELQLAYRGAVFLNGMLHLLTNDFKILAVDTEGKKWRTIPMLETMTVSCFCRGTLAFIGQSQGRLYFINMRDYDSGEWIFKYSISTAQIFGEKNLMLERDYALVAIHPECNMIFFVCRCEDVLISYDMDHEHLYQRPFLPYLPYVPFFSDSLSDRG